MYFILIYNKSIDNLNLNDVVSSLFSSYVSPFEGVFVIGCNDSERRLELSEIMLSLTNNDDDFRYIITPMIDSTGLNGFFNEDRFDKLKEIFKDVGKSVYGGAIPF